MGATRVRGQTPKKDDDRAKRYEELERQREKTDRRTKELLKESEQVRKRLREAASG
jgi:hypothetical protein